MLGYKNINEKTRECHNHDHRHQEDDKRTKSNACKINTQMHDKQP